MFNKRTDLALEAQEMCGTTHAEGVSVDTQKLEELSISRVCITNKHGENLLKKPQGTYVTLEIPSAIHKEQRIYEHTISVLAEELKKIVNLKDTDTVLVVGLGNWNITADALGPRVVSALLVTRHMFEMMPEEIEEGIRPVCAISPGVLGITGIETGEIVRGIVEKIKPQLVIAIDSLASRKLERISTTIQISNTGITPGGGIGNVRLALNEQTLGVPVIAIGVPTVVDAATMASDTIDLVLDRLMSEVEENCDFYKMLKNVNRDEKYQLINDALSASSENLVVTPKEVDEIIEEISELIANSINIALHSSLTINDLNKYQ